MILLSHAAQYLTERLDVLGEAFEAEPDNKALAREIVETMDKAAVMTLLVESGVTYLPPVKVRRATKAERQAAQTAFAF